jgi:chromosome segregation ATPase
MDSLEEATRADYADAPGPPTGENIVIFPPAPADAEDDPGAEVLQLVEKAATRLRRSENQCANVESRTRALLERAIEQLERAAERIESLEADCERCNARTAEANARALMAEDALKRWDNRFGAIEAQMSATEFRARSAEARASKSQDMLRRVEEAIRSKILERQRSRKIISAAAA